MPLRHMKGGNIVTIALCETYVGLLLSCAPYNRMKNRNVGMSDRSVRVLCFEVV